MLNACARRGVRKVKDVLSRHVVVAVIQRSGPDLDEGLYPPPHATYQRAWCKQLVLNAVGLLMRDPLVITDAPTTAAVTLNAQPSEKRLVLHLLH